MPTKTTLAVALTATDTQLTAVAGDEFPAETAFEVAIGTETIRVPSGPPADVWTDIERDVRPVDRLFASDDFEDRELPLGFGPDWRRDAESQVLIRTSGGVGIMEPNTVGGASPVLLLPERHADVHQRFRFMVNALPVGGNMTINALLRDQWPASQTYYFAALRITPAGVIEIRVEKNVAGSSTNLSSYVAATGTAFAPNEWWTIAFELTGANPTALRAKAWRESDGEPASWQTTGSDSEATLQGAGEAGVRYAILAGVTNLPTFNVDDFTVARVASGQAHAIGAEIVLVEPWPIPITVLPGRGAPTHPAPTGAQYVDLDTNTLYTRIGAAWRSEALT